MIQISLTFGNAQIWLDRMDHNPLLLLDKKVDGEQCRPHLNRIWRCCLSDHPAVWKPYDVVLRLKIIILGVCNNVSNFYVQETRKVRHDWRRFLRLHDADESPDEKTIWKYRHTFALSGAMVGLFADDTAQMAAAGYSPQDGQLMDSSWVPTPKPRNTWAENKARKDEQLPGGWEHQPQKVNGSTSKTCGMLYRPTSYGVAG